MKLKIIASFVILIGTLAAIAAVTFVSKHYKMLDARAQAGVIELKLPTDGSGFPVELRRVEACGRDEWGPLAATLAVRRRQGARVLFTIEPLDPHELSVKPVVRTLTIAELTTGLIHRFQMPQALTSRATSIPMGAFVCIDSTGAGRCAGKVAGSYDDLVSDMDNLLAEPRAARTVKDRVVMFHLLFIDKDRIAIVRQGRWTSANFPGIERFFTAKFGRGARAKQQLVEAAEMKRHVLSATEPVVEGNRLVLALVTKDGTAACSPGPALGHAKPSRAPNKE